MKLLLIYAILIACVALSVNANSENCENVKEELNLKFEVQNDQQHDSDEQFVAVHVDRLGVQNVNPDVTSIEAIVGPFLPKNYHFLYALNVTREIVNGFKYEIFFVMKNDEDDEELYCVVDILEKPWLIKYSLKYRKMTFNNCSLTNPIDEDDRMRFKYEVNPTFINQKTDLSEEDIKQMEDQIISLKVESDEEIETTTLVLEDVTLNHSSKNILDGFFNMQDFIAQPQTTTTASPPALSGFNMAMFGIHDESMTQQKNFESEAAPKKDSDTLKHLEIDIKRAFSELFQSDQEFQMNIVALINRRDDMNAQKNYNQIIEILGSKLKDKLESYHDEQKNKINNEDAENEHQVTVNPNESISRKRRSSLSFFVVKDLNCFDSHEIDVLTCADCSLEVDVNGKLTASRCLNRQKRQGLGKRKNELIPGGRRQINIDDPDLQLFLNEALVKINADEDPDYESPKILEASVQVVSGTLHRFKVEMQRENNPVICDFEIWERAWLKENGRDVKVKCENEKLYHFKQAAILRDNATIRKKRAVETDEILVGGPTKITDFKDVNELLEKHLSRLDTGDENNQLELVSIEKGFSQVVAGIRYFVTGTFKIGNEEKKCDVDIWHRAWIEGNDGTQIKADCEDKVRYKTRSRRSINHHQHHHHYHHHRPRPDHDEEHHQTLRERHHHSAMKQMEEVKHEVMFENFVNKFQRKYVNDEERDERFRIFKRNLHKIDMLNKHELGTAKYGINEFADLTQKEYLRKTGLIPPKNNDNHLGNPIAKIPDVPIPEDFDWRDKGAVTDVKNQGNCGSCWSFSVTGNIEGLHAIKTGKLEAYSEQELLDCDTTDNACNGGYMDDAFKAIEKIGGLELEDEYPYLAKKQKKCMFNQTLSHVKVKGVVDLPKGDEIAMQKFLVSTGPISIGINANAMQFYRGGVSHPWKVLCRKSNLDHGVLIVGFGKKEYPMFNKTLPYWTIKNSWGPKWGEQGYYRVYRGDNTCGVAEMASSAVLE